MVLQGVLQAMEADQGRRVHAFDSFEGIPVSASQNTTADSVDQFRNRYSCSLEDTRRIIQRYGLLDSRLVFHKGFFNETLVTAANSLGDLALLHLDADSYQSTTEALTALYPRLSPGGWVIVEDWHIPSCRRAVFEYRLKQRIRSPMRFVTDPRRDAGFNRAGGKNAYWRAGPLAEGARPGEREVLARG